MIAYRAVAFKEADEPRAFRGGGMARLREHNCAAVLRTLLDQGPLSRTQLARRVALTQPALSYITAELLNAGLVEEREAAGGTARAPGRQAVPLDLAPSARCAVAVHLGATGLEVGFVDLRATLLQKRTRRIDHGRWGADPRGLAEEVRRQVRALTEQAGVPEDALLGAGVGVAGWVDGEAGLVRRHEPLGWRDVPLAELLGQALGLPVLMEDHVRAMALAEAWFGTARKAESFALLYVGAVVGCSVVFGRRVHRGHAAAAGGIGVLPARPDGAAAAGAGRCPAASLEAVVSDPALVRQALALARHHPDSVLVQWLGEARPSHRLAQLVAEVRAAGREDPPAAGLLAARARALAPSIAQVVATYDPQLLAIAGPMGWDADLVQLRFLRQAVAAHAPGLGEHLPPFVPSTFGSSGALVGPAALVLQELYSPPLATYDGGRDGGALAAAIRRRARAAK